MITRLRTPAGCIALSFVALVTLLVRSYTDTRYILVEDFSDLGPGFIVIWITGYAALIGGWVWALLRAATTDARGPWTALLGFALLTGLGFGAASWLAYADFGVELLVYGANLIVGIAASAASGIQLRRTLKAGG